MDLREDVLLRDHTTFRIGGQARFFAVVRSPSEVAEALSFAAQKNIPVIIVGGGSNILADDAPCNGLVLKIELRGRAFERVTEGGVTRVTAASGESWDELVSACVARGLWGFENLSGIPGTVGGAVVQNIGAYGAALSESLESVSVFDRHTGRGGRLSRDECAFGYRESIFKKEKDRYVVLGAFFTLSEVASPVLSYKDLAEHFAHKEVTLPSIRDAVLAIRRQKFPDLSREGTAGSFFKNPVVSEEDAKALVAAFPGLPVFHLPEAPSMRKIPLAWFLDYRHGVIDARELKRNGARLFERQPLVLVNDGTATAADVRALASDIVSRVRAATGITIEPEVCVVRECAITNVL